MKKPSYAYALISGFHLLSRGRYSITFDQLEFSQVRIPLKKRLSLLRHGIGFMMRAGIPPTIPPIIQLEPSNACNLGCLTCPTGSGMMKRPPVMMSFETCRDIIDQIKDYALLLVFWSWGEPFMHRDACRMIGYAKKYGLLVHSSTNGHFFTTKEKAREVVESGLDSLIVAVDGLDQKTYEKYRKRGNLKKVIQSVENLVSERAKAGTGYPRVTFRFIVMKHNEHQVHEVSDFARNLGVDIVTFRSAVVRRRNVDLEEDLAPQSPEFQRFSYTGTPSGMNRVRLGSNYCHRPYANLTVLSNGDVIPCENDFNGTLTLGNAGEKSLREILSSEKSREFYKSFRLDMDHFSFCRECELRDSKHASANVKTVILNSEVYENKM